MKKIGLFILIGVFSALLASCAEIKKTDNNENVLTLPPDTVTTTAAVTEPKPSESQTTTQSVTAETMPQTTTSVISETESQTETSASTTIFSVSKTMYVMSPVNVRREPNADSEILGSLSTGTSVEVVGDTGSGWVQVLYYGNKTYINVKYLSDTPVVTTTAATTTAAETTTTTAAPVTTVPAQTTTSQQTQDDSNDMFFPSYYNALNYSEQKGMWFSFDDMALLLKNKTEEQFRVNIAQAFDNTRALGCNTVYVHVRAFGDAYYQSSFYAWSKNCTGTVGVSPGYDPLQIMVEEAHSRGLSIHAWVNPMRTANETDMQAMPDLYRVKQWYNSSSTNGTYIIKVDGSPYYWLSPAYSEVRKLICDGIAEIVSNYDVDGIHIDDYFYPTTESYFDEAAFKASGASDLTQWRLDTISEMVRNIYSTVKSINPTVMFGVSPQGNIGNNYAFMFADVKKWCAESGYLDYIVPQVYFGYESSSPFDKTSQDWSDMVTNPSVKIVYGLAPYKIGTTDEWSSTLMMKKQINTVRELQNYDGIAFFRYGSLFTPASDVASRVSEEIDAIQTVLT